jgi:hypothetical protein
MIETNRNISPRVISDGRAAGAVEEEAVNASVERAAVVIVPKLRVNRTADKVQF